MRFHNPEGCTTCNHAGVTNLTLIAEMIPVEEDNRKYLKDTTNPQQMRVWMKNNNIPNIHQHALEKVRHSQVDPHMVQRKISRFSQHNLFDEFIMP